MLSTESNPQQLLTMRPRGDTSSISQSASPICVAKAWRSSRALRGRYEEATHSKASNASCRWDGDWLVMASNVLSYASPRSRLRVERLLRIPARLTWPRMFCKCSTARRNLIRQSASISQCHRWSSLNRRLLHSTSLGDYGVADILFQLAVQESNHRAVRMESVSDMSSDIRIVSSVIYNRIARS